MRDEYQTIIEDMTDPITRAATEREIQKLYAEGYEPYQYLTMNDVLVATLVKPAAEEEK